MCRRPQCFRPLRGFRTDIKPTKFEHGRKKKSSRNSLFIKRSLKHKEGNGLNTYDLFWQEFQRALDPLVAVQVYNACFCPLTSRLPEELHMCILEFLFDDAVALHCLRVVSMLFLRLLHLWPTIWNHQWYEPGLLTRS